MGVVHFAAFADLLEDDRWRVLCGAHTTATTLNCDRVTCQRCRRTNLFGSCNIGADYHGEIADAREKEPPWSLR